MTGPANNSDPSLSSQDSHNPAADAFTFQPGKKRGAARNWLLSFLDISLILLAFFLILSSMSEFDEPTTVVETSKTTYDAITDGIEPVITPIWELYGDLAEQLKPEIQAGSLILEPQYDEIRLTFTDGQLYESGSAVLLDEGRALLEHIMESLAELKFYEFHIDVEGHTDDRPIQTMRFPSNWELSTARASGIIRYFAERGFPAQRLKASGFADIHPLLPNRDEFGNPIPDNMAVNRRIVIRIFYELGSVSPAQPLDRIPSL